jgi:hypothetical protein
MKRFRWWILALLLLGGVVLALVSKPEREQFTAVFVKKYNAPSGQERVVVRISNQSKHDFWVWATSEAAIGNEGEIAAANDSGSVAGDPESTRVMLDLLAGSSVDVVVPRPSAGRVKVAGYKAVTDREAFLRRWLEKLWIEYPRDAYVEKVVEFNE